MRLTSTILQLGLLLGLLCTAAPAVTLADRPHGDDPPRLRLAQNGCVSLGEAVERVRRQYNGRIVSAETHVSGNREVHYIKVLTDNGQVKTVTIPGCPRSQR